MNEELVAIITCPKCQMKKGRVFSVPSGGAGVRHNITEPAELEGKTECPDCQGPLEIIRAG